MQVFSNLNKKIKQIEKKTKTAKYDVNPGLFVAFPYLTGSPSQIDKRNK